MITDTKEICICAAVKLINGLIIRGHRHSDCIKNSIDCGYSTIDSVQGFMTSQNRFVDREEALVVQQAAGIPSAAPEGYRGRKLYSDDLY